MANWVMKRWNKVAKQLIEYGGRDVNHSNAGPLRMVGKALHMTTSSVVYKPTLLTYILTCSSGCVPPP